MPLPTIGTGTVFATYAIVLAIVAGYLLWKGGAAGRANICVILIGAVLTKLLYERTSSATLFYESLAIVDTVGFVIQLMIAVLSRRTWCIWVAALQLNTVVSDWVIVTAPAHKTAMAYMLGTVWSIPMLAIMAVGVWRDNKAQRQKHGQQKQQAVPRHYSGTIVSTGQG